MQRPLKLTVFVVAVIAIAIFISFKQATSSTPAKQQVYEAKASWSQ